MKSERVFYTEARSDQMPDCVTRIRDKGTEAMAISLSGGGALFGMHLGAMMSLWEYGISPDLIVGTSAGSLAAAIGITTDNSDQLDYLVSSIKGLNGVRPWTQFIQPKPNRTGLASFKPLGDFVSTKLDIMQEMREPPFTYPAAAIVATDMDKHTSIKSDNGVFVSFQDPIDPSRPESIGRTVAHACTVPVLGAPEADEDDVRVGDGAWCMNHNTPLEMARLLTPEAHHVAINIMPPKTRDKAEVVMRRGKRFHPAQLGIFQMSADIVSGYRQMSDVLTQTDLGRKTMMFSQGETASRFHKIPTIVNNLVTN